MRVRLTPTADQRAVLERLQLPDRIVETLQKPSFELDTDAAETVRDELTTLLPTVGFDADYELTAEGRIIEDLIDALFIP